MLTDKSKIFNSIDYMRKILVALVFSTLACNAQEKKIAYPPCISIGFYSSDILNCPYDQDTELKYRKIKYRLSDGNKNLSSSNYVAALYFFKLALNDVKPCYSDPATIDDTGMYEVLARSAEERGDYKYAATLYGSILENRMSMYDEKINKNKASCITAMKSSGNYSNAIASATLEIKFSGKTLSAIIKITNNNDSPIFIYKENSIGPNNGYGRKYFKTLAPIFVLFKDHESIEYTGPKMSGLKYKPDDFYQLAPHTTITIGYKNIEKQYNLFYNKDNYIIVHRHIEYDPDKGSLTLINSNPVNFSYAQQ